jgi:hypothetical protein
MLEDATVLRDPGELAALFVSGGRCCIEPGVICQCAVGVASFSCLLSGQTPPRTSHCRRTFSSVGRQHSCLPARLSTSRAVARKAGVT